MTKICEYLLPDGTCRCAKRNFTMLSKLQNYKVLAVFPGPGAPANMRPYLRKTVIAFKKYEKEDSRGFLVGDVRMQLQAVV